ncbi:MAG: hypothetical protein ACE5F1_16790 [Planctomycetota bacterium]
MAGSATPIPNEPTAVDPLPREEVSPLIVLDERQLEEPIEAAIRRIREDPARQGSRILVIGSDEEQEEAGTATIYPQAAPGRGRRWFLGPDPSSEILAEQVDEAIRRTGRSWLDGEEILRQWFGEQERLVLELEQDLYAQDPERLAADLGRLRELTLWVQESLSENLRRAERARQGMEPLCTVDSIRDAARRFHDREADVDLLMPPLNRATQVTGQAATLQKAFLNVFALISHRIGNSGRIRVQVEEGEAFVFHRFEGIPRDRDTELREAPPHLIEQIRHLIVSVHRGRIRTAGRSGLVIALPSPRIEFLLDSRSSQKAPVRGKHCQIQQLRSRAGLSPDGPRNSG